MWSSELRRFGLSGGAMEAQQRQTQCQILNAQEARRREGRVLDHKPDAVKPDAVKYNAVKPDAC